MGQTGFLLSPDRLERAFEHVDFVASPTPTELQVARHTRFVRGLRLGVARNFVDLTPTVGFKVRRGRIIEKREGLTFRRGWFLGLVKKSRIPLFRGRAVEGGVWWFTAADFGPCARESEEPQKPFVLSPGWTGLYSVRSAD